MCKQLTTKDEKIQLLHRIALVINFTSHWQVNHVFPTPHMVLRVATLNRRFLIPFSKRTPSAKTLWAKVYSKNVALQKWAPELLPSQAACRPQKKPTASLRASIPTPSQPFPQKKESFQGKEQLPKKQKCGSIH